MPRRKKGSLGLTAADIDESVEGLKTLATRSYKKKIGNGLYVLVKPRTTGDCEAPIVPDRERFCEYSHR